MRSIQEELSRRVAEAVHAAGYDADPLLQTAQDERFGDYQANCAMAIARQASQRPREVAERIAGKLDLTGVCDPPEIAGPGFINLRLLPSYLASCLASIPPAITVEDDHLGIDLAEKPEVVVVDLSSPNLAKEMHVGHLRSTVIGDCVCRILEFAGHAVHRENHVGDWGTQFGMLVAHLLDARPEVMTRPDTLEIRDMEAFYVEAKERFDRDEAFKKRARETVVALQGGDPDTLRIWKAFCNESLRHCHRLYDRLGVRLVDRGESTYNELMPEVIRRLEPARSADGQPLATVSDGALCVFLDGFTTREGDPLPLIVRKSDGGYNYATSDLATIIHRVETLGATRIIYVVGLAQKQHFDMVFAAARRAGWAGTNVALEHLGFGNMLSASGKPFKTREGGTVKLKDLLDEAVARAKKVVIEASAKEGAERDFSAEEMDRIAETVGLAAVKYFDLSRNLQTDYKFDPDTMLALDGNTAPYMLYAYARVRAIGRKAGIVFEELPPDAPILLEHPAEARLALAILRFAERVAQAGRELRPNMLTDYLYDLSRVFSRFYDRKLGVRVIDADPPHVRISRLKLCDLTARVLRRGLHLLGIDTLEQM